MKLVQSIRSHYVKTEISRLVAVASTLGLLAFGGQTGFLERQSDNMSGATQSTSTFADHDSMVKGYENTAKETVWHQKMLSAIFPLQRCTVRSEMGLNKS